ncbi:hypothetical protein CCR75_001458 [Bremia lactucae]|uniref:PX domain-containing protein n=1 Tax=Bremia lactucae TaxID=4779 RepID=A0A976ILU1_BRELC|nr:hypothetical protein CCR75_001458 [Bremia lactucae]
MEGRNGKWVNVDYTNRIMEESGALPPDGAFLASNVPNSGHENLTSFRPPSSRPLSSSTSASSNPPSSNIQVAVSEPVKQGEGMNSYISYKISTTTTRPQFVKSSFSVVRRYSDFVWIHGHLNALFPGVVVPPLPEKLLVGRFSPEFIESRRRALQLFLHRCCLHPELQHSEHLTTFLEASEDQLQAFRKDPRHAAPNAQRGVLFQWIDETVNTISSTLIPPTTNLPKTPADLEIEDMMAYIESLEPITMGLHKHAHGLTKRAREIADGLFELGVSFTLLGKSEDNVSLQEGLNQIGHCSDTLSILAAEHAEREALHFEEPIFDYIRLVGAVKAALQKRNELRCAYGNAVTHFEAQKTMLTKILQQNGHQGMLDEKDLVVEKDVQKAQEAMERAKLEDEIVTERVLREVERFKRAKLADFKLIILDYIQIQIEYSKRVEDEWQKVIPKLARIQVENEKSESVTPGMEASTNGAFHQQDARVGSCGPMIHEDYIPSNQQVTESFSDLTLMDHDRRGEDLYQRSPYGSRPLEDSNSDVAI